MTEKNYILMLEDSLKKKINILCQLQNLCQEQADILSDQQSTPEAFEENVEAKGILIEKLETMDAGFESLFSKVKDEMEQNKEEYKDNILRMQDAIREITERSTNLQVMEKRNQELARSRFAAVRTQARELRQGGKAVTSYYQNMMQVNTVEPQFWDSKK